MAKVHRMRLAPEPLKEIRAGRKTIELRLYDDKRKAISIGDRIVFMNVENENDTLTVIVKNLFIFASFEELYRCLPLMKCGYTEENIDKASPDDMEIYYPRERQNQYGVVGIEIALI